MQKAETNPKQHSMTYFQTDRQIIERLIVPAMASTIVLIIKQELLKNLGGESEELNTAHSLLRDAMEEPFKDIAPDRVSKIVRRTKRVATSVLNDNFDKPLALQYLIIAYWVIDMAEQGVICVGEQSSFSRAWDIMAEVLVSVDDKFDEMAEKAATGAIHLGNALRAEGLFRAPA